MVTVDAGSPILIEVQFTKAAPFKTYLAFDPTTATYDTFDPTGTALIDVSASGSLLKVAGDAVNAGRYYCIIKTEEEWENGEYKVKIHSSHGTAPNDISDVDVKETAFTIKNSIA